jgi:hypothetical protein
VRELAEWRPCGLLDGLALTGDRPKITITTISTAGLSGWLRPMRLARLGGRCRVDR